MPVVLDRLPLPSYTVVVCLFCTNTSPVHVTLFLKLDIEYSNLDGCIHDVASCAAGDVESWMKSQDPRDLVEETGGVGDLQESGRAF